jgi:hypothetical protein
MAKEKIIYNSARLTGFMLLGATVLHGTLGTAEVMTGIKVGDVRPAIAENLRTVWIYSTIMLFLSACWTFFIAGELRQLSRRAWWQGVLIGLGYAGGSAFAMATIGVRPHLIAFALIGLFLLVPLLIFMRLFKSPNNKSTVSTRTV